MSANIVIVSDSSVQVANLLISRREVVDYLRQFPEEERDEALVRAIEVGVFCLERATAAQDTEFVKRQVEGLLNRVEKQVGEIPKQTQEALVAKLGTADGQVLAPIKLMVENTQKAATDKINEVRKLLESEIDPTRQTTTLGRALNSLRDLLDPNRNDSVQCRLEQAVKSVTAADGSLAKTVKEVVAESVKPLSEEVDKLAKEIRGQEAAEEITQQTPLKGHEFEDEVVGRVREWASITGAEVEHVGADNQPGDVAVKISPGVLSSSPLSIIVEAKDRGVAVGRKAITLGINEALNKRNASYGIWVSKSLNGFAKEIGEWAEGQCDRGPWIACTFELLHVALRFALVQQRMAAIRAAQPEVDAGSIVAQIQRIRTSLSRIGNITRKVTDVRTSAQDIQEEAESLRDEIKAGLTTIEDALRVQPAGRAATAA